MRESLIISSIVGSFIIFCLSIDFFDALIMFVLFGVLPGQVSPLSASSMLVIYTSAATVVGMYALRGSVSMVVQAFASRARQRRASTS
jgi:hypothetical protein